ncbi:hypothetical protein NKL07_20935 [Mesorhizobium sp. C280B]|uniref:hypothetical protein n=1 Tax=unclassified Mesorhizobium TaxID=325217 RepID=UPI0003CE2B21|nr:hypothetical protein [Mesorhizobium sp. LSJC280B00]ESW92886.1 hypothetical protein X772_01965 [Mesorhizobium sp. LSJC280B00]
MATDDKSWTKCTTADEVISVNQYISAAITSGIFAAVMVVVVVAMGEPWCIPIALVVTEIVWILAYCDWWLNKRLVCLGEPVSIVGMVISIEPPSEKTWPGSLDSDYSLNLLLPNNPVGVSQAVAAASAPFGYLMAENAITSSHGFLFTGNPAEDKVTGVKSEALHVEFEGASIHDLQTVNILALIAALAALALCMSGVGVVVAYVLALLALLASLLGAAFSSSDTASPSDAGLPSIETNKGDGTGATIQGVTGRWVYDAGHIHDSFHEGHNELHPVQQAQILGRPWDGDWPDDIDEIVRGYQDGYAQSQDPLTKAQQARPGSRWSVHPYVDGCNDTVRPDQPPH